jgi:hypothetical protein
MLFAQFVANEGGYHTTIVVDHLMSWTMVLLVCCCVTIIFWFVYQRFPNQEDVSVCSIKRLFL